MIVVMGGKPSTHAVTSSLKWSQVYMLLLYGRLGSVCSLRGRKITCRRASGLRTSHWASAYCLAHGIAVDCLWFAVPLSVWYADIPWLLHQKSFMWNPPGRNYRCWSWTDRTFAERLNHMGRKPAVVRLTVWGSSGSGRDSTDKGKPNRSECCGFYKPVGICKSPNTVFQNRLRRWLGLYISPP